MNIVITKETKGCAAENCPAEGRVEGLPGYRLFVGKRPETLLDEEALGQLRPRVGPDEYAVLVPDDL